MKGKEPCPLREGANARAEGEHGDHDPKLLKGSEIPECFCAVLGKEDEVGQAVAGPGHSSCLWCLLIPGICVLPDGFRHQPVLRALASVRKELAVLAETWPVLLKRSSQWLTLCF